MPPDSTSWVYTDVKNKDVEDIVILSGDHLYCMDYMDFVNHHRKQTRTSPSQVAIGRRERASDFGLMKCDENLRITTFSEKPEGDALEEMKVDTTLLGLNEAEVKKAVHCLDGHLRLQEICFGRILEQKVPK